MNSVSPFDIPEDSVAILLNGKLGLLSDIKTRLKIFKQAIAVDGGLQYFREADIRPVIIIGDLDSTHKQDLSHFNDVPRQTFPRDKDQSDFELALQYVNDHSPNSQVNVFASTGLRIDHTLSNLFTISRSNLDIFFENQHEISYFITKSCSHKVGNNRKISLIPFPHASNVTTNGLKWEITHKDLNDSFFSLSNQTVKEEFTVQLDTGCILLTIQKNMK